MVFYESCFVPLRLEMSVCFSVGLALMILLQLLLDNHTVQSGFVLLQSLCTDFCIYL